LQGIQLYMGYGFIKQNSLPITGHYFYCALMCVCVCEQNSSPCLHY